MEAQRALDRKTKPPGSLGRLESLAVQLAVIQRTLTPAVDRGRICVFATDHGVAAEGVSAYPAQVTAEMTRTFARGGAAIGVLAREAGLDVEAIDVGVNAPAESLGGVVPAKIRRGSRNFVHEPAMTAEELACAIEVGREAALRAAVAGVQALGLGEMGIGNTTAAAALLSALTGADPGSTVGRGTGIDDAGLERKRAVVAYAVRRHAAAMGAPGLIDPRRALACLGGLEIAAIAGAALEAPGHRMVVVVDGFIATVAVLAAASIARVEGLPEILPALVFAHRSAEWGHGVALEAFAGLSGGGMPVDTRPLLDLGLRLGEGTGSALATPILRAAARVLCDMATFEEAGVSGADGSGPGSPREDLRT
ncbi:MAG: nicotinate-nucleotide--dimethylbenzimidazole phosphoribosyltransferase [Gemmatimonadales bacterium]